MDSAGVTDFSGLVSGIFRLPNMPIVGLQTSRGNDPRNTKQREVFELPSMRATYSNDAIDVSKRSEYSRRTPRR